MANRRMIYQDFFEDEYFGTVEPIIRLFWIGLITAAADDQGRILDNSSVIKAKTFLFDRDVTEDMIDGWLKKLNEDNKLVRYTVKGKRLIQIVKWWEYQTPAWASPSKYPAPDKWTDRVRCHVSGPTQGGSVELLNWEMEGGFCGEQTKKLPSLLPSQQGEGIDKLREDDVNLSNPKPTLFDECQRIYEKKKGLLVADGKSFTLMVNNFEKHGVTAEDYSAAIDALDADPKYNGSKPTSYEKWAIGYAEKRKNPVTVKPNGKHPTAPYPEQPIVVKAADGFYYNSKTAERVEVPAKGEVISE